MYKVVLFLINLNKSTILKKTLIRNFLKLINSIIIIFYLKNIVKLTFNIVNKQQFVNNVQKNLMRNNRNLRENKFNLIK